MKKILIYILLGIFPVVVYSQADSTKVNHVNKFDISRTVVYSNTLPDRSSYMEEIILTKEIIEKVISSLENYFLNKPEQSFYIQIFPFHNVKNDKNLAYITACCNDLFELKAEEKEKWSKEPVNVFYSNLSNCSFEIYINVDTFELSGFLMIN